MLDRKRTEEERIEENISEEEGDLACEEAIIKDKERFGRVRKSLMKYLRTKYGDDVANRALWRVNRRRSEGYFRRTNKVLIQKL